MTWERTRQFVMSATGRLAASYLVVIMGMSLGYSVVLYSASSRELQRQVPPDSLFQTNGITGNMIVRKPAIQDFLEERTAEAQRALVTRLVLLNMLTLVGGAGLSYFLARRTLKPIEDNMEAQSQFVSDASHELRTPLTTLQTSNEVALRNSKLSLSESKKLLEQNVEEVAKLQSLVDALLKLARQEAGKLQLKPVSLQDVAADAMNRVVRQAQAKAMTIEDKVPDVAVLADRPGLAQAVVVLLDNAIKYGPKGSTVHMGGARKGKVGTITVRDEGPGIRPYDLRRIFDRFYRADQSRSGQHVPGHGIGLSLARKLVEQQGGGISVDSTVGKGSTFTIAVPLA